MAIMQAIMQGLKKVEILGQSVIFIKKILYLCTQKGARLGCASAIGASSIALCLHEPCGGNYQKKSIMPEICHFYGIVITMYLPDHNPPHFHVRYNEYRATIDIQTGRVTGQMPRRALHLVFEWLDQHKDELMLNWERMENGETLVKINPLD